jgi:hypothetical protein
MPTHPLLRAGMAQILMVVVLVAFVSAAAATGTQLYLGSFEHSNFHELIFSFCGKTLESIFYAPQSVTEETQGRAYFDFPLGISGTGVGGRGQYVRSNINILDFLNKKKNLNNAFIFRFFFAVLCQFRNRPSS